MIDKPQAEHLAALIHAIRDDWGIPGIMRALEDVRHIPLARLTIAAVLAARAPGNRTPKVIALDGEHWRPLETADQPTPTPPRYHAPVIDPVAQAAINAAGAALARATVHRPAEEDR